MSTYHVVFRSSVFATVEVEADSPDEAAEFADAKFDPPALCHYCSRELETNDVWEMTEDGAYEA